MNIFVLSQDPQECVKWMFDTHIRKMPTESAQMLCTAHRVLDGKAEKYLSKGGMRLTKHIMRDDIENVLYKETHVNHPCNQWTRSNSSNYNWHFDLFKSMLSEFEFRFGKTHESSKLLNVLEKLPKNIYSREKPIEFVAVVPESQDRYKKTVVEQYKSLYKTEKNHLANWTKRDEPEWFIN